ncbi:serpin B6-like [Protopterus annectens]|uniref:serpin B6-like n=1 Tax=Protopterus annectens TaxID=7888 RepID=UPI001CFB1C91|nr:serpin B6-like [Protopterus annectens]
MASLCEANTTFALEMYKKITEEKEGGNIFFSPLSMSSSLSMVLLGAKDATAAQMSKALQLDKCKDVHSQYQELITAINNPSAVGTLKMANRLFGEQMYNFLQTSTSANYNIDNTPLRVEPMVKDLGILVDSNLNFENLLSVVVRRSFYMAQLIRKIQNLLTKEVISNSTRLVLVNAIYFKCDWDSKFKESNTKVRPFRISKVEKNLSYQNLVEWTKPNMMDNMQVMVQIPKFKLEDSYDLKPKLISMGMVDAFSPAQANFSGMSDRNDLFLSEVVHKAFVEVNEEGTEAAAATAVVMKLGCARGVKYFDADHPFIFTIVDCKTSTILFIGRFCSP